MKKKALLRRGLVLFMSASLLFTQPAIALAADTAPAQESGEEIILDEEVMAKAKRCIDTMLELGA